VAPFGCAFFSCQGEAAPGLSASGIRQVRNAQHMLYGAIWNRLSAKGLRQHGPEVLRSKMREKENN
jgi:hypothetical protein